MEVASIRAGALEAFAARDGLEEDAGGGLHEVIAGHAEVLELGVVGRQALEDRGERCGRRVRVHLLRDLSGLLGLANARGQLGQDGRSRCWTIRR